MIYINLDKAKIIAHKVRREFRANEFSPLDEKIAKQIPGMSFQEIESQRQEIRDKYALMQLEIDASTSVNDLKSAISI